MEKKEFSQQFEIFRDKIASLYQLAGEHEHEEAFQEIATVLEELQVAEEELMQQNEELLAVFVPSPERPGLRAWLARISGERLHQYEARLQPAQGEPFEAELRVQAVCAAGGAVGTLRWLVRGCPGRARGSPSLRLAFFPGFSPRPHL